MTNFHVCSRAFDEDVAPNWGEAMILWKRGASNTYEFKNKSLTQKCADMEQRWTLRYPEQVTEQQIKS